MKNLLKMSDLSREDIIEILSLADQLKYELKHNIPHRHLEGKTLGMIFQKSSTRTRVSFETGMYQLGGNALFLSSRDLQIGRGEPVQDTARVLSRYLNGIMIRTFEQKEVEDLANYGNIPIINGLTDYCHPCQVLADLMTVREYKGQFDGLKMCYIGDGNNMANSLIVGGLTVGMEVSAACPEGYHPDKTVLDFAKNYEGKFTLTADPVEAAANADVIFTDVWASWVRRAKQLSAARCLRAFIRSTIMLWLPQSVTQWYSTACLHTVRKRSPQRCSRLMQRRYLTKQRTVSMHRRLLWSS